MKESARSVFDFNDPPPPLLPNIPLACEVKTGRDGPLLDKSTPKGPGVWGAESHDEEVVGRVIESVPVPELFSSVAEFSGGTVAAVAFKSVFCNSRTLIRTMDRRWSLSSDRSAETNQSDVNIIVLEARGERDNTVTGLTCQMGRTQFH